MKKQVFVVLDTETTKRNGMVFDAGWTTIDRSGKLYGMGSFLFKDILEQDNPFYRHKIASYWQMAWNRDIRPVKFKVFRKLFNLHLAYLRAQGLQPIVCAYNAAFDTRVLSLTSKTMTGKPFLNAPVLMLDIWDAWAKTCPKRYVAEVSPSGNIRTRAEDVFKFESNQPDFVEAHTGYEDTKIEAQILLKVLSRKRGKLPIVTHPKQFNAQPWRTVQQRLAGRVEAIKAAQLVAA